MTEHVPDADAAVADVPDGATVLIGGFGTVGQPMDLIDALRREGVGELTVLDTNAGNGDNGLAALTRTARSARSSARSPGAGTRGCERVGVPLLEPGAARAAQTDAGTGAAGS